jgi:hypothetical protein
MRLIALALLTILLTPLRADADNDIMPPITDPLVKKECGECHLAFQPRFLPAPSWRKIMQTLADHFGEDASLEPEIRDKVGSYLIANAANRRVDANNPPLKITQLFWFRDEHNDRDAKRMLRKLKLKSIVDCVACHRNADRGYFD